MGGVQRGLLELEKKESVTGLILKAKWLKFEEEFNVPEAECLSGWVDCPIM